MVDTQEQRIARLETVMLTGEDSDGPGPVIDKRIRRGKTPLQGQPRSALITPGKGRFTEEELSQMLDDLVAQGHIEEIPVKQSQTDEPVYRIPQP